MAKILSIQSSINDERSVSKQISAQIIEQIERAHPGSTTYTLDLAQTPVPHFGLTDMQAVRAGDTTQTAAHAGAAAYSNKLLDDVFEADHIVIGVPFYNFHIPSTLKAWLDRIAVPGRTFSYQSGAPEGLVKGKKVYLAIAQGGIYSQGPMKDMDNTESYLRAFLGFLGMTDITTFRTEGLMLPDLGAENLKQTRSMINAYAF